VPLSANAGENQKKSAIPAALSNFVGPGWAYGRQKADGYSRHGHYIMCASCRQINRRTGVLPTLLARHKREELQFINIGERQIAERVAGIEDEGAELSDHGIIESRMIC
jgi:hypothetical protein